MKKSVVLAAVLFPFLLFSLIACGGGGDSSSSSAPSPVVLQAEPGEALSGGETSIDSVSTNAFSFSAANLSAVRRGDFLIGNDFFEDPWVIAPATTNLRDGLGPIFNVASCQSCHVNDGRGHAPETILDDADSLLIRMSRPAIDNNEQNRLDSGMLAALPDDHYGDQLQERGILGVPGEARVRVRYEPLNVSFTDGFTVELRRPIWQFDQTNYGEFSSQTTFSVRVAPPVIGLGLLEAIAEADVLANEDENDQNADGISGRANWVWNVETQQTQLGRFGWKAGQPNLLQQSAAAFSGDIGLTTRLFPNTSCLPEQTACLAAPNGVDVGQIAEITDAILEIVEFYVRNLAVPSRRLVDDQQVLRGKQLFSEVGCASCHVPRFQTTLQPDSHIEQSLQQIRPYSDLLLHDMGADLADFDIDNQPAGNNVNVEFLANAREWRTPPLWGIGLSQVVSRDATFLHDGRARNLLEAVLWHGGEAENSKQQVLTFSNEQREELLAFLHSL